MPTKNDFAGKSFLPLLTGESKQHHDTLFWSKGPDDEWAVRRDQWKLHWNKGKLELVNLADDLSETRNLAGDNAEKVKELREAYDRWIVTMADPITGGSKRKDWPEGTATTTEEKEKPEKNMTQREIERVRIREERRAEKKAVRNKEKGVF